MAHKVDSNIPMLPARRKLEFANNFLIAHGIISNSDGELFLKLIDYRNVIGHEVHDLTCDVGAYAELGDYEPGTLKSIVRYDHSAAKSAARLRADVQQKIAKKFVSVISFRGLRFDAAEKVYLSEIRRLKSSLNRRVDKHNKLVEQARKSLDAGVEVIKHVQPGHPRNFKANGSLSARGVSCMHHLFEFGATPLAISHLMRISLSSVNRRLKEWQHLATSECIERKRS